MLDNRLLRKNPEIVIENLKKRHQEDINIEDILALDTEHRQVIQHLHQLQAQRNDISGQIAIAHKAGDKAKAEILKQQVSDIKQDLIAQETQERQLKSQLEEKLLALPNIVDGSVPLGQDEADNQLIRTVGHVCDEKNAFDHLELGEKLGLLDIPAATSISGARFNVLYGPLARLERALAAFMLDKLVLEYDYQEVAPPLLVRSEALQGTGQLPKFSEDSFVTTDGRWLIPTAEVPLTNLVREQILEAESLPLRFTAYTPCFRSEAGSAGRDTRGILRQHQFNKVEMVSVTTAEHAIEEHERMTACAESILQALKLPYRVVLLCSGDTGFSAKKTYDLEVWLPGQKRYREISSCSWCGDFQARRMNTRFRAKGQKQTEFVHTLNGSALAVGRTLLAVMENYQEDDGSIVIPEVLKPYWRLDTDRITKAEVV